MSYDATVRTIKIIIPAEKYAEMVMYFRDLQLAIVWSHKRGEANVSYLCGDKLTPELEMVIRLKYGQHIRD